MGRVIPIFIWDPQILESRWHRGAANRRGFLCGGLVALDTALRAHGNRLYVLRGAPREVLRHALQTTHASCITACADYSPYARQRDMEIARELPLKLTSGIAIHAPDQLLTREGKPYTVFTPFYKSWRAQPLVAGAALPVPFSIPAANCELASELLPVDSPSPWLVPGEGEAYRRCERFMSQTLHRYGVARDFLAEDGTSLLSPYLRFGMLSPRWLATMVQQSLAHTPSTGAEIWLKELAWRDFYLSVLCHFPHVTRIEFNPRLRAIAWRDAPDDLAAWQTGHTGYPIVDACMRQLLACGWMHNRGRMIVASFLVKDLLIDWRLGEAWFMRHLLDGDPAANNGGWQWAAGVGTDPAPYFRIFNPVLQGEKFDPRGDFVRRWVPELSRVPTRWVHRPWEAPPLILQGAGVTLGRDYPHRIVDRAIVKARALAAYRGGEGNSRA